MQTIFPSFPMYRGSSPKIPAKLFTAGDTGRASSERTKVFPVLSANSFSTVARPPLVTSRISWMRMPLLSRASTISDSGALSLVMSFSICILFPRSAAWWSPRFPERRITSPSLTRSADTGRCVSSKTPHPAVLMRISGSSPERFSITLVSPATTATPASFAVSAMARTQDSNTVRGRPSSRIHPAVRYSGLAPLIKTSLTVPQTESLPMFPPGNSIGVTTKESVVRASSAPPGTLVASSIWERYLLPRYFANRRSIRCCVETPPAPSAIVTLSIKMALLPESG